MLASEVIQEIEATINNMMPGILKIRLNSATATVFLGFDPISGNQLALRLYGSLKVFCASLFSEIRGGVASAAVSTASGICAVVLGGRTWRGSIRLLPRACYL